MKVVLTGGGTGGHFYPLIAVAEDLRARAIEKRLIAPTLFYVAPDPYDQEALFENGITFARVSSGKLRRYFSFRTPFDLFMVVVGFFEALWFLFRTYPDVIFSKGGYASVPVVLAGALLRIPIIVHESDAKPGRATLLASGFASYIAIAFPDAASYFPKHVQSKIALTGIPVRSALRRVGKEGIEELPHYDPALPLVLCLGGSLGAERLNDVVIDTLPTLLESVQVIHQTGRAHIKNVEGLSRVVLEKSTHKERYHPLPFLGAVALGRAAAAASVIVARAGSGTIAEISLWGKPVILIPIPESISHDQRTNAYAYTATGGGVVIEETNLSRAVLEEEILRIARQPDVQKAMGEAGAAFARPDAGTVIADAILGIIESHEAPTS